MSFPATFHWYSSHRIPRDMFPQREVWHPQVFVNQCRAGSVYLRSSRLQPLHQLMLMRPLHQIKCTRYDSSADVDFEGGYWFPSLYIVCIFVCELSICYGDRSASKVHKTCNELSNRCVVPVRIGGSILSSLSTFLGHVFFATAPTFYRPCITVPLKKKTHAAAVTQRAPLDGCRGGWPAALQRRSGFL